MEKNSTLKNLKPLIIFKKIIFAFLICLFSASTISISFGQGTWTTEPSVVPITRHENGFVECNGKFYLLGGRELGAPKFVNIYDPATQTWTSGSKPDIEMHHFQAVCHNNLIYVIGALTGQYNTAANPERGIDQIYIYNPADNTWTKHPTVIPAGRVRGSAGVAVYNNEIYIAGGNTNGHNGGYVNYFDKFNPATGEWTALTNLPIPTPRDHFHAVVMNNKLFLTAGRQSSASPVLVAQVDVFDFIAQSWSTYPNNIPTARAGASSVAYGNEIVVIGGEGSTLAGNLAHNHVEALNVSDKTWRTLTPLNTGRHATQAIVYNGKIYIASGSSTKGGGTTSQLQTTEVYTGTVIQGITKAQELHASCYPNPVHDKLRLTIDEPTNDLYKVNILNAQGISLQETSMIGSSDLELMMSEYPEGIYFVNIHNTDKNVQQSLKIIKR